eukprot:scpid109234/ scgid7748/ 
MRGEVPQTLVLWRFAEWKVGRAPGMLKTAVVCQSSVKSLGRNANTCMIVFVTKNLFEQESSEFCVLQKSDVIITVRNSGSDIGTVQRNASGLNLFSCHSFFISYFVSFLADPEEAIST